MDLYAEDTSIFCSGENSINRMKKSLDNAIDWFIDNKFYLNSKGCKILSFGREHGSDLLSTPNVKNNEHCKYLGFHVDEKLKFDEHIRMSRSRLARFCGVIYK